MCRLDEHMNKMFLLQIQPRDYCDMITFTQANYERFVCLCERGPLQAPRYVLPGKEVW